MLLTTLVFQLLETRLHGFINSKSESICTGISQDSSGHKSKNTKSLTNITVDGISVRKGQGPDSVL